VRPANDGQRLDVGAAALSGLPRRQVRALIDEGRLWLNARPCRVASRVLHLGDVLDVIGLAPESGGPDLPPLAVVYEDGWLVAVDKPRGAYTQPPRGASTGLSVLDLAVLRLSHRDGHRVELKLVHRLDRITSGVLVLARQRDAAGRLAAAWSSRDVDKRYLAVVRGAPAHELSIDAPIGADPLAPGRFRVDRHGREAHTHVRTLAAARDLALIEARPFSGRTHQVRVHLAERGHPVLGDGLYGGGSAPPGPFLHAWRLTLPHPRDGRTLQLTAPIPDDFAAFLAAHGLGGAVTALT